MTDTSGDPSSFLKVTAPSSFSVLMTSLTNSFIFSDIAHIAFMASLVCCRHPRTAIGDILHILSTMVDLSTTVDVKSRHLANRRVPNGFSCRSVQDMARRIYQ